MAYRKTQKINQPGNHNYKSIIWYLKCTRTNCKFLNQINQRYAYNSIVQMSEREGFQLAQSENPQNGSVRLLLRKFN